MLFELTFAACKVLVGSYASTLLDMFSISLFNQASTMEQKPRLEARFTSPDTEGAHNRTCALFGMNMVH